MVLDGAKYCRKVKFNPVSRLHERYRRQTYGERNVVTFT